MREMTANAPQLPFELEALSKAKRYQSWIYDTVKPFLGKRILELGSGVGNMSTWLPIRELLVLSEPNPSFVNILKGKMLSLPNGSKVRIDQHDLSQDSHEKYFNDQLDTIISFNVFEHIEDDFKVMKDMCEVLRKSKAPGPKHLITFVPAHNWAYGGMDKSFGHYRRYSTSRIKQMKDLCASGARMEYRYFNLIGLMGWVINGKIRGRSEIGMDSIRKFEAICPYIRHIDDWLHKVLAIPFGQSLVCIFIWD